MRFCSRPLSMNHTRLRLFESEATAAAYGLHRPCLIACADWHICHQEFSSESHRGQLKYWRDTAGYTCRPQNMDEQWKDHFLQSKSKAVTCFATVLHDPTLVAAVPSMQQALQMRSWKDAREQSLLRVLHASHTAAARYRYDTVPSRCPGRPTIAKQCSG